MATPDQTSDAASRTTTGPDRSAQLAELRKDLSILVADVKKVADARVVQVRDAATEGVSATRDIIRSYPVASVAVATIIGAAAAIIILPASQARPTSRFRAWMPDITQADLREMAHGLQRTAAQNLNGPSLLSTFERVVDSVSSIDPKATLTPAIEKAGTWLSSMREALKGK